MLSEIQAVKDQAEADYTQMEGTEELQMPAFMSSGSKSRMPVTAKNLSVKKNNSAFTWEKQNADIFRQKMSIEQRLN